MFILPGLGISFLFLDFVPNAATKIRKVFVRLEIVLTFMDPYLEKQ